MSSTVTVGARELLRDASFLFFLASRSLSAYLVYRLGNPEVQKEAARFSGNPTIRFEYTVISNIYSGGLPPLEAAGVIVEKATAILKNRAAGNRLEAMAKKECS